MKTYTASYDTLTKVLSGALVLALAAIAAFLVPNLYIGALMLVIAVLGYAYSPRGYRVVREADGRVVVMVDRLVGSVRLAGPFDWSRRVSKDDLRGTMRLWGSGGFFGYYGLFRTSAFGRCEWFAASRANLVVLRAAASGKVFVLSPDDVAGFLADVPASEAGVAGVAALGDETFAQRWLTVGKLVGVASVAAAAVAIVLAFTYAPGAPAYRVANGALVIEDRFYPVKLPLAAIDVAGARVLAGGAGGSDAAEWRLTARTNGFANAHYRSGWFRTASGKKVRLYQAEGMPLVLLPPSAASEEGVPVLIAPEDPERLLREVREAAAAAR